MKDGVPLTQDASKGDANPEKDVDVIIHDIRKGLELLADGVSSRNDQKQKEGRLKVDLLSFEPVRACTDATNLMPKENVNPEFKNVNPWPGWPRS